MVLRSVGTDRNGIVGLSRFPNASSPIVTGSNVAPADEDAVFSAIASLQASVTSRVLFPIGGGADDGPAINEACSGAGSSIVLAPGVFTVASVIAPASFSRIRGSGMGVTTIVANFPPPYNNPNQAIFRVAPSLFGAAATTVANPFVQGSRTLNVASSASVVAGTSYVVVAQSALTDRAILYKVVGKVGNSLTLDRPILPAFVAGDQVTVYQSVPTGISVSDMTMTGSNVSRNLEFVATWGCRVSRVEFSSASGQGTDLVASFDIGGFNNRFEDCFVDGGGTALVCLALESQESSSIIRCVAQHSNTVGGGCCYVAYDSYHCDISECFGWNSAFGAVFTGDGNTVGCSACVVSGGAYTGCGTAGIQVEHGSSLCSIDSQVTVSYNAKGIQIGDPGGGACTKNYVGAANATSNTGAGLTIDGSAVGTRTDANLAT